MRALLAQRLVQTNEVWRCSAVAQACAFAARQAGGRPLALIEIGTSAGLNLFFERYRYRYTRADAPTIELGPVDAAVLLEAEWRGRHVPLPLPQVIARIGIDLNLLHVDREADRRWLRALIWPEHSDRRRLLEAAMAQSKIAGPLLLEGSACEQLPHALVQLPVDALAIVLHTHVMHQVSVAERATLHAQMQDFARTRDLVRISNDLLPNDGNSHPVLLQHYFGSEFRTRHIANAHGHGRWIEWLQPLSTSG